MSDIAALAAITPAPQSASPIAPTLKPERLVLSSPAPNPEASFAQMLSSGAASVEAKVDHANTIVKDFTLDDSVPIHQVMMALEEARLSVELGLQVRNRLIEGYREIMNMQI